MADLEYILWIYTAGFQPACHANIPGGKQGRLPAFFPLFPPV